MTNGNIFNLHITLYNPFDEPIRYKEGSWLLPPGIRIIGSMEEGIIIELQPGDSHSLSFQLKVIGLIDLLYAFIMGKKPTRDSLAKTGEQIISVNLSFEKGGITHWQEVQSSLNIYAAPIEVYAGAIIGTVIGSYIKKPVIGFETIASAVFGFFLVLIVKRRTDIQLGISVEDWIGGIIIGFSVGYLGTSYFESFLPKTAQ